MTMFVGSLIFVSLPSFMFVSATVSEMRKSNQNKEEEEKEKKNFENSLFNLAPFLGI